ncbi:leucyl aminopeptidase family protein [Actinoplanes sp. NPDC051411]|uniref:leucyl aminopeptidase family protein n=1 Tax=Actinoplanes sp. NPDC051411 TaxID=3155522 RepID=UPI00343B55FC
MFAIRLTDRLDDDQTRVVPVGTGGLIGNDPALDDLAAFAAGLTDPGEAGTVNALPRPLRRPAKILLVGVGGGDEAGWRTAGAAAVRALPDDQPFQVALTSMTEGGDATRAAVRGLAEGIWLGGYRYRDAREERRSGEVQIVTVPEAYAVSLAQAQAGSRAAWLARDLTNTPSSIKTPDWFAEEVVGSAAGRPGVEVTIRSGDDLARFGGIRAVGGASKSKPCLVEVAWRPAGARTHVVLIGKGITFDSGGISIKTRPGMKTMKHDMAGAAAVVAATLAAADLGLEGVRITALAPMAENAVGADAFRPGDVITHYDGSTSESTNSDAEGRLVLADALGYAVAELEPDVIVDIATLTGAQVVALGETTAALYSGSDDLAATLTAHGAAAGERMWRMPLVDDYRDYLRSEIADRHSSPAKGGGPAALFLREFLGDRADRWAHIDMAGPAWTEHTELELTKGATGWGARTLLRYLAAVDGASAFDGR